jgi:hypothetical protein
MTRIAEGRMIVTRIKLPIPPMKGEAVVREPTPVQPCEVEQPEERKT